MDKKPQKIKSVSGAVGFSMQKSKGQHLLKNPKILEAIKNKSGIKSTDIVLERGPGTGNLTMLLLQESKKVIAIELDPRMVAQLLKRVSASEYSNKLQLIQGDILKHEYNLINALVKIAGQSSSKFSHLGKKNSSNLLHGIESSISIFLIFPI